MQTMHEAKQLVRSYSIELGETLPEDTPANDLRRVFIESERLIKDEEERSAQWRAYYEPWKPNNENVDPLTKVMREQAVLLSQTWMSFRGTIPKSEQDEIEGKVPSVDGLIGMVETAATEWQKGRTATKSGRFMKHFTSVCQTLDAHSSMLEVLPNGNEYVSLFTGSLKTIINAASNYEKIAKGLGEALTKIGAHVAACQKEVRLHQTRAIIEKIALLYAHVFLFLNETMKWYLKKPRLKFCDSFRENFYEQFEDMITTIQNHSEAVKREAHLTSMAETKQSRVNTEDILDEIKSVNSDGRLAMDGVARDQANIKYGVEQLRLEIARDQEERRRLELHGPQWLEDFRNSLSSQIATGLRQELMGVAQKALADRRFNSIGAAQARQSIGYLESSQGQSDGTTTYQRDSIILASNHLFEYFSTANLQSAFQSHVSGPISLETTAASSLKEWTTSTTPDSQFISVAGRRPKGLEPPPMTILASMCVNFSAAANLPVISYFISLPPSEELRGGNSREVQGLISLTYALIRQFIEQLPVQFSSSLDFGQQRLLQLNGTMKSWEDAMSLLKDLVKIVPRPLFCIVDGFQVLDDWSTEKMLEDVVRVLKEGSLKVNISTNTGLLKILFTTTGRSRALVKLLDARDLLLADRDGAVNSPARRGGTSRFIL